MGECISCNNKERVRVRSSPMKVIIMTIIGIYQGIVVINPRSGVINTIIYMVLSLINGSIMIIIIGMNYIGLTLIIIYAVGISMMIIFIIMMLDINKKEKKILGEKMMILLMMSIMIMNLNTNKVRKTIRNYNEMINNNNMINKIGYVIYTEYVSYLIMIGIILLMVMIAVINLNKD